MTFREMGWRGVMKKGSKIMAAARPRETNPVMAEETAVQAVTGKVPNLWGRIRHYFHEVQLEMKKVSWPSRTEVFNTTVVIVLAIFFFAAFIFVADIVLSWLIEMLEAGAKRIFY
ncbi:MAG: preprotein translocase subunit SecE [Blastocatellia bacterium]